MKSLFNIVILFLVLTGISTILMNNFNVDFGTINFWDSHGIFFLIFITLFPRLTLLLSSVATGGLIWWLAWIFTPRLLVATLASFAYWQTNPILVVMAWLVALGGESSEKTVFIRRGRPFVFKKTINLGGDDPHSKARNQNLDEETIEAEFTVKNDN